MKMNDEEYKKDLEHFLEKHAINFGVDSINRIVVMVLLCNITRAIRKSDSSVRVIDVINKILNLDNMISIEFWYKISFWCEALLKGEVSDFPDFGFVDTKAKVTEIKRINDILLPF